MLEHQTSLLGLQREQGWEIIGTPEMLSTGAFTLVEMLTSVCSASGDGVGEPTQTVVGTSRLAWTSLVTGFGISLHVL